MSTSSPNNPLAEDLEHILAHTRELWETARGRSIFVTGGTGFFGRWLLESFAYVNRTLDLDARMTVLSRDPSAFAATAPHLVSDVAIQFVTGDVCTFTAEAMRKQLSSDSRFDFVIHAATEASGKLNAEDPLRMLDTIVEGTRATLNFALATGARRFLFTSSGAVYGPQPSDLTHVPEDYLGAPDCTQTASAYGEGKRIAELLCASFQKQYGLETLIARCFAFVGPFLPLDAHFAIGNFIRDALRNESISVKGDGTPYRSYLHAADLAIWLWVILFKGCAGRCYNVGSEDGRTIAEVAEVVAEVDGASSVHVAEQAKPGQPASRYVPSARRAQSELGLETWIDLPAAVRRTVEVIQKQQETGRKTIAD